MSRSDFHIHCDKFQDYSDKLTDWFIRSFKYKQESDEWKICRLKCSILKRKSMEQLKKANNYLND